jgi:hypothetical protein
MIRNILTTIRTQISAAFAEPDPLRFAEVGAAPSNWRGELVVKNTPKGGPILTNKDTRTFEFGQYSTALIHEHLTELDKECLQTYNLDVENPAYALCKRYFAANPYCTKTELAANSSDTYTKGISANTAAKVLAAFRAYLEDKPTF